VVPTASDEVRPDVVRALARVDSRLDPAKAEVALNATEAERVAAARLSAEAAIVALHEAGVVITPNVLDYTLGQVEVIAACWGIIARWDVSLDRSRRLGDALDSLAFDGGEAPGMDAARILVLLRLRELLPPQEDGT
jgi:hypothetical protein